MKMEMNKKLLMHTNFNYSLLTKPKNVHLCIFMRIVIIEYHRISIYIVHYDNNIITFSKCALLTFIGFSLI